MSQKCKNVMSCTDLCISTLYEILYFIAKNVRRFPIFSFSNVLPAARQNRYFFCKEKMPPYCFLPYVCTEFFKPVSK